MMISSRVSAFIVLWCIKRSGPVEPSSGDLGAADVQLAFPNLAVVEQAVGFPLAGPDQVDDVVPTRDQELRDQPPVAPLPRCLGAHQAGRGLRERLGECRLPLRGAHARGVAAERCHADARKALLARLAASAAAELDRVAVADGGGAQRLAEPLAVELRVAPGAGEAAHVDERFGAGLSQAVDELRGRTGAVADREDRHSTKATRSLSQQ